MEGLFTEVVTGSFANRNTILPLSDASTILRRLQGTQREAYSSYYHFPEEMVEHVKKTKSVELYEGPIVVHQLLLDIDKGLPAAQRAVDRLLTDFGLSESSLRVYFSGTGFHIVMPDFFGFRSSPTTHQEVKATLSRYFPEADNIYDKTRVVRAINTFNSKSGCFKIPIPLNMLNSETNFMEIATKPSAAIITLPTPVPTMRHLIVNTVHEKAEEGLAEVSTLTNDVTCMQKAFNHGPVQGHRHETVLRMASAWKRKGLPEDVTLSLVAKWLKNPTPEALADSTRAVKDIYTRPYSFGCADPIMTKWCDSRCKYFKAKDYNIAPIDAAGMEEDYRTFVTTVEPLFDLRRVYQKIPEYTFYPGEYVLFFGDTKLGKTAFIQNLIVALKELPILFFSLEVQQQLMFRRFIQIAHNLSKKEVAQHYIKGGASLTDAIKHIKIIPPTSQTRIQNLRNTLRDLRPAIAVIDTIDCITIDGVKEWNTKSEILAYELMHLSHSTNTLVIAINHIPKSATVDQFGRKKDLTIHSSKGSSALEQKADKVLTIEPTGERTRVIKSAGARDEAFFAQEFQMSPDSFIFTPL